MKFGLEEIHWKILEEKVLDPLKSRGFQVWVFGSRARGDHKRFSDIDLLVSGPSKLNISDAEIFLIKEGLAESNLPIKVDLVFEKEVAPSYANQIKIERVQV